MSGSVRSFLAAGAVAAVASAIVVAPPPPGRTAERTEPISVARIDLAAAATPISPPDREEFTVARDALSRLDPAAAAALAAPPTTLNAASDSINSIYQWIQYWVDYGVELTQYVLQFIPYGYLIGDQVGIVYYNLVRPISDSVVYQFIDPVVNDPLNIWSYINGAVAVGSTTVTALINTGIAEFNYFFGWLIPPLPPLPFAAEVTTEEDPQLRTLTFAEPEPEPDVTEPEPEPDVVPEAAVAPPEVQEKTTPEPTEPAVAEVTPVETVEKVEKLEEKPTVDSKDGVSAQGEVRTGGQTAPPAAAPETVAAKDDEPTEPTQATSPTATTPTGDAGGEESADTKPAESTAPSGADDS